MKILITGIGGQLGSKIYELSPHENYGTYFGDIPKNLGVNLTQLNLLERDKNMSLIKSIKPEWVIHCAAATDVDWCEREKKAAWDINVEATRNVVDACKQVNARVIYISTSFVFDAGKGVYYENDSTNPINNYGLTKLEGEKIIQASGLPFIIARTDQLYGWTKSKKNFVKKVLDTLNKGEKLEVFEDWYNNPTLVDNLAEILLKLLEKERHGIYHTTGSTYLNRYDWALKIAEIFGFGKSLIVPITSAKYNPLAKRPGPKMDNSKAQRETGVHLFTIDEGLEFMKNHPEGSV